MCGCPVSGEAVPDLGARSFGLQMRYRYEFASQRDLYAVYACCGYAEDEGHDRHAARLFLDASRLRDSDQVRVKLRWRL